MNENEKLKPCPFCSGRAVAWGDCAEEDGGQELYTVECINCGANIGWLTSRNKAIVAWNRRDDK
jgi:Lar family restriction alleviation protein